MWFWGQQVIIDQVIIYALCEVAGTQYLNMDRGITQGHINYLFWKHKTDKLW